MFIGGMLNGLVVSTIKILKNGHANIGAVEKTLSNKSHYLLHHIGGCICLHHFPGQMLEEV